MAFLYDIYLAIVRHSLSSPVPSPTPTQLPSEKPCVWLRAVSSQGQIFSGVSPVGATGPFAWRTASLRGQFFCGCCVRGLSAGYTGDHIWRRARDARVFSTMTPRGRLSSRESSLSEPRESDPQIALLSMLFLAGVVFPLVKSAAR
jgi:hypothetical protein